MAHTLPDEVLNVFWAEITWEDGRVPPIVLFAEIYDTLEIKAFMLFRIAEAFEIGTPPDFDTELNDWCLFVVNEIVEFGQDFGVNNIKGVITLPNRRAIADDAEAQIIAGTVHGMGQIWTDLLLRVNKAIDPNFGAPA